MEFLPWFRVLFFPSHSSDVMASVESVKAASDVFAPISGTITEINEALADDPSMCNTSAEGDGWFVKMTVANEAELEPLMTSKAQYEESLE